ncbi:hypothetical protein QYE76_056478 [Lolium multiflorum]|uniref:Uncharacterized protein n=1 Tax=Lolium multiflorum TaxID=4521 RepID=A0AAD8WMV7_LOLMU|nr:hypothetical protein QYE76_056478 [Lolium multiflorum]
MAQTLVIATEKQLIHDTVALAKAAHMPAVGNQAGTTHFRPTDNTRRSAWTRRSRTNDVVVKTKETTTLLDDLRETFTNLRRFRMKLNPAKCTFGVPSGQLLGYLVSQRGIEANPEKIGALEDGTAAVPQGRPEVRWLLGLLEPLRQPAGGEVSGFFGGCEFHHVPRANNEAADALSKIGSTRQAIPPGIALAVLKKPSIIPSPDSDSIFVLADRGCSADRGHRPSRGAKPNPRLPCRAGTSGPTGASSARGQQPNPPASKPNPATMRRIRKLPREALLVGVFEIRCVPSWAQEFLSYLTDGVLPDDRVQARQVERRAKAYTIINHQLYKRSEVGCSGWIEAKPIKLDGSTAVTFLKEIIVRFDYPHSIITTTAATSPKASSLAIKWGSGWPSLCGAPESNGQVEKANGLS